MRTDAAGPSPPRVGLPSLPALVPGTVIHTRWRPLKHRFRYRTYQWLVDVDDLPHWPPLASFDADDHLGRTGGSLRAKVGAFAGAQGMPLRPTDRVVMLANARSLGHVFDPISVYWCLDPGARIRWVVLEVHNTYGERHAHLVRPNPDGRLRIDKQFYVSPFFTLEGHYDIALRLGPSRVAVSVILTQHGARVFSGSFTGTPRPADRRAVVAAAVRTPLVTYRTSVLIRLHGLWLWLRRLRVVPRPRHVPPEGIR